MHARFKVVGEIKTKQRPRSTVRGGFARVYTPQTTAVYENLVKLSYEQQCKGIYFGELPLKVDIYAYFKAPETIKKYVYYGYDCVNHKDLDNIAKTILDALNGIAYKDDKQVVELCISKHWVFNDNDNENIVVIINSDDIGTLEIAKKKLKKYQVFKKLEKLLLKEKKTKKDNEKIQELAYEYEELGGDTDEWDLD